MNATASWHLPVKWRKVPHGVLAVGGQQVRAVDSLHLDKIVVVVDKLSHAAAAVGLRRDEGITKGHLTAAHLDRDCNQSICQPKSAQFECLYLFLY